MRSDPAWSGGLVGVLRRAPRAPLTSVVCLASLVIFIGLQRGPTDSWERLALFGAPPIEDIWNGAFLGLLTTCFVHIEPVHLLCNLYWMWTLGQVVEHALRWHATLALFVAAGVVSTAAELAGSGSTGIGLSGLVYALFGFLWGARNRVPAFKEFLTRQVMQLFLVWLVACFVATWAGVWNVGNYAHLGGLVFGYGVAAGWSLERGRRAALAGTVLVSAAVLLAAFWRPWDGAWVAWKAHRDHRRGALVEAERGYMRSLELAGGSAWLWRNLALLHMARGDEMSASMAREALARFDPDDARELAEFAQDRAELVRAYEHAPEGVEASLAQARLATFDWNLERAETLLRELLRSQPEDPRVLTELATFLVFTKESPSRAECREALALSEQAVATTARRDPAALWALGEAYFLAGDRGRAVTTAEELRALYMASDSLPPDFEELLTRYRAEGD
ncbi:MAG: rhomboid family intramembrane serine protease [Planctomycetota bacterium]